MNAPVHTSALQPEADLFGAAPTHREAPYVVLEATLTRNAEVRNKLVGDGDHVFPVLSLELRTATDLQQTLHVEQVFSESTRHLAEKLAATLKRGDRVRITSTLLHMHVRLPHAESIERLQ